MSSLCWRYLSVGAVCALGLVLLPYGVGRYLLYLVIGASGVGAVLLGIRIYRPRNPGAWYLIAAGNATWLLGDALYDWSANVRGLDPWAVPVLAYLPYLFAYGLLGAGMVWLARSRDAARRTTALLDTAIVTAGLGLVSWVFVIIPGWAADDAPLLVRLVGVVYPLCDVLLVATGIRLLTSPGLWNAASRLLVASVVAFLSANALLQVAQFSAAVDARVHLLGAGWLLAYVLWGAAALHPSMSQLTTAAREREDTMLVGRLLVLAAAVLVGPAIVAGNLLTGRPLHLWPVLIGAGLVLALVLTRMIRMVRQLKRQADRLVELAETDFVTGLANRRVLADRLETRFAANADDPDAGRSVLVLIGVQRFAELTNTLGQQAGDAILRAVGARLLGLTSATGFVARAGDDTLGVLTLVPSPLDGRVVGFRDALEMPYRLPELSVSVEVCIGAYLLPHDGATPELALHRAGIALASARSRPGRIAAYRDEMETGGTFAGRLVGQLRAALLRDEIVLHYQPQVEIRTGRVLGVEALARWEHPEHGLLGPDSFIPAAEQTGLIGPFTHYVLDRALEQCAQWRGDGLDLTVAVNLSVRNLLDPDLLRDVRATLARHDLPPTVLELEITEGTAMVDLKRSIQVLGALADLGITLSIDDYGTGHSSLAYLQRLPVQRLKIDRSFVTDLLRDDASATIVRSTIELARNLRFDVIAEGVEDDETLLVLKDMQCYAVQGFGLGRPVPAERLPALVREIESRIPGLVGVVVLPSQGRRTHGEDVRTNPAATAQSV